MIDYRQASGIIIEVAPFFLGGVGAGFVGFCSLLLVGTMMAIEVRLKKTRSLWVRSSTHTILTILPTSC